MKFLHTSDWHIGRQFHNVSLLEDQAHVLEQIIDYMQTENIDALVIAGDLYDRSVPPAAAVALLDEIFQRIGIDLGIPILLIPGNHDSAQRLGFASKHLSESGLYIFSDLNDINKPINLTGKSGIAVNFYGIPYNDPEQARHCFTENTIKNHNDAHSLICAKISQHAEFDPQANNVLISHCFVDGAEESESERPLSIGGADRVDFAPMLAFDYVALGHLHSPQYRGDKNIRYSGSILKYSFSEVTQKKAVTLVEVNDEGTFTHQSLPLKAQRDMRILEGELEQLLQSGLNDKNSDDYLLIRLTDKHAILDAMGKLRQVYKNVLHLEKTGLISDKPLQSLKREQLKRSEVDMFKDFFNQTTGNDLDQEQQDALAGVIDGLRQSEVSA
ncbi:MAG: exonuclease SbcCD subunit D [Pseudomonadales bacterium]|nr:exonuclease SbcCD subunit D [Pseudomonadales bacterium]